MFLATNGAEIVLFLHILAATVWIGGQVTIAMFIPLLRGRPDLLAAGARRFQQVAWVAFVVLVLTGIANIHNAGITWHEIQTGARGHTLVLKLTFVLLSGAAAAVHAFIQAPRAGRAITRGTRISSAVLGSIALLAAMAAAFFGVVIAEH